ncbi:NAD(P)-binding protein [Pleurotus eryngii]|uniref:NAD(P)-binding protein n=1 Tax=Pleurotus eryngii TaxID=5323 RepID=A0A9P5ZXD9_PLEER|nr:NAD(P)-binding protein [Pleurotus eryngii]
MPLREESITSFFKPTGRTSDNCKSRTNHGRDSTKRARTAQDGTESKAETSRKKSKSSPTPRARASGSARLQHSPSGSQTLLTDLLQRKKDDAPKQSKSAKHRRKLHTSVIDLTNSNEDDAEDAAIASTTERSGHRPKQSSVNSKSPQNLSASQVGSTSTCPSYRPNELDIPSFGTINTTSGSSGRLIPSHILSSPPTYGDPSFFDVVPSSQSQDLERELPLEPTRWYMGPASEPPASPPFTPRKRWKAAFPDVLSSPAVPSSQTQELYAFDSPTTVRTSPAVRSSQMHSLYLLDTPSSVHASPMVASSQTQTFCMFDTPTRHRILPAERQMSSVADHKEMSMVPSSQAVEKEPSVFGSPLARNSQLQACLADGKSIQSASTSDAAIEPPAPLIPALSSLDSPSESQVGSRIRLTEYPPPATPSDAPRFTLPPDSPPQEDHSQQSDDGNLEDHPPPDSLPVFNSQPGIGLPASQLYDDTSQAGAMAISDFFNIFDEGGGSLPADFPIPLWGYPIDVIRASRDSSQLLSQTRAMVGRLPNKVALVTGAGSGIGLESSILFAQEGANVVLVDINLDAAEKTAKIIASKHPNVRAVATKADVGKEADVKAAVDKAVQEFGRLDVMFNNAGIMHPKDDDALTTEEHIWDLTMQINLKGVWWGCKYAILAMRNNPTDESKGLHTGGSIINTASFVAILGAATPQLAYTASKGGVLAMSRELAVVHAREGIRVNSLCPGPLKTPLLMDFLDTPEKKERRLVHVPMGRFGEAIEIAKAALFLASDDSSYVTGADFTVDGGITSAYVTPIGNPVLPPPTGLAV